MFAVSIQLAPLSTVPMAINRRGPNLSISLPWKGEKKVCRIISSEKVSWISASGTPSLAINGFASSAQTYCGLEMEIMHSKPSASCTHFFDGLATTTLVKVVFVILPPCC